MGTKKGANVTLLAGGGFILLCIAGSIGSVRQPGRTNALSDAIEGPAAADPNDAVAHFRQRVDELITAARARSVDDTIGSVILDPEWTPRMKPAAFAEWAGGIEGEYQRGFGGYLGAEVAFTAMVLENSGNVVDCTSDGNPHDVIRVQSATPVPPTLKRIGVVGIVTGSAGRKPGGRFLIPSVEAKWIAPTSQFDKRVAVARRAMRKAERDARKGDDSAIPFGTGAN